MFPRLFALRKTNQVKPTDQIYTQSPQRPCKYREDATRKQWRRTAALLGVMKDGAPSDEEEEDCDAWVG